MRRSAARFMHWPFVSLSGAPKPCVKLQYILLYFANIVNHSRNATHLPTSRNATHLPKYDLQYYKLPLLSFQTERYLYINT